MTEQAAEATQADAVATSQADTDATDQTERATQADAPETMSLDEAKKLRSEASSLRRRLKEAEGKVQSYEDASKTEAERQAEALKAAQDRATNLEQRVRDLTAQTVVTDAARTAGAVAPSLIYRAVRGDLEFDEDGNPTNVDAVLADLKKSTPEVFRAAGGSGDGGKGTSTNTPIDRKAALNQAIRQELGAR